MSIDKSLKKNRGMAGARNVLSRGERIQVLMDNDRWTEGQSPVHLPKVRVVRAVAGKKKKKAKDEDE